MLTCSSCGFAVRDRDNFCSRCGTRQQKIGFQQYGRQLSFCRQKSPISGTGERKQATILFADIKGSTQRIEHLDAESVAQLLELGTSAMTEAVHQFGGTVCRVDGDGILALFGAPEAQEEHAARACLAALEMQERANSSLTWKNSFRVGISSGEIVVKFADVDLSLEYRPSGAAVHLASRLESLCRPGAIYVSPLTYSLANGAVKAKSVGRTKLRGFTDDIDCYEIVGRISSSSRRLSTKSSSQTEFVGRDYELNRCKKLAIKSAKGHGQIIFFNGDAGTGKSRIIDEAINRNFLDDWKVFCANSTSFGQNTPFSSVGNILRDIFGIKQHDTARSSIRKASRGLTDRDLDPIIHLAPIATLLNHPFAAGLWKEPDHPNKRHLRVASTFIKLLTGVGSLDCPVLLVFEDLHWADDDTKQMLGHLLELIANKSILVILTARPEFTHTWHQTSSYHEYHIEPFSEKTCDLFMRKLLGEHATVEPLFQLLRKWTAGTPFFIEEIVRSMREEGSLSGELGDLRLLTLPTHPSPPTNVQNVIASRIDRLSRDQKNILQLASVVGQKCHLLILMDIARLQKKRFDHALEKLDNSDFITLKRQSSGKYLSFKHSLIHEVTYASILREDRCALHAQALTAIEKRYKRRLDEHIEELAEHAKLGQIWDAAASYSIRAADKAAERSAYDQAVEYFKSAISVLSELHEDEHTAAQRIDAELGLRRAYGAVGQPDKTLADLGRVEHLAKRWQDHTRLAEIKTYKTVELSHQGKLQEAMTEGRSAYVISSDIGDKMIRTSAAVALGLAYYHHGAFDRAAELLGQYRGFLLNSARHNRHGAAGTISVRSISLLAGCKTCVGDFRDGIDLAHQALRIAEEVDRPIDIGTSCYFVGVAYLAAGHLNKAIAQFNRGIEVCELGNVTYLLPWLYSESGLAAVLLKPGVEFEHALGFAVEQCSAMNLPYAKARALVRSAQAYLHLENSDCAHRIATEALLLSQQHEYRATEIWALQVLGEVHILLGQYHEAEIALNKSLHYAISLGMRPDIAKSNIQLGALFSRRGNTAKAKNFSNEGIQIYHNLGMKASGSNAKIMALEVYA